MKPVLILCLGNEVLSDDRFGYEIAERLKCDLDVLTVADVEFAAVAGFYLLDLLQNRERVLIVDTISTGAPAGTIHHFDAGYFTPGTRLTTSHQISLPTALELSRQLGLCMPEKLDVLAVEAQDLETLTESLTPAVQKAIEPAITQINHWIEEASLEEIHHDLQESCR